MKIISSLVLILAICVACNAQTKKSTNSNTMKDPKIEKTESEWKAELSEEQYFILRQKGTERPGTGKYNLHFEDGTYTCAGCDAKLFASDSKFDAHCGWPSFDKALDKNTVIEVLDKSHGMVRTEIQCANCGGHLGHVFNDGPTETGMRYCINSGALDFSKQSEDKEKK